MTPCWKENVVSYDSTHNVRVCVVASHK